MGNFRGTGCLARGLIPVATRIAPKVVAPLATGALSGLESTGIGKLFGTRMINIPASRKTNVLKTVGPYLTKGQKDKFEKV